jgi:hypothetical protein|tara:strand:- start:217 stop:1398 length:1182 start_codon:yes stop_codon:yes gene_type:complete
MNNRDFLKEAIADAKAVKESAIANAKVALEEAFSPQVQAMFASRLEEMESEELEEGNDEVTEAKAKKEYKDDDRKDGGESKETKRTEKMKYGKDLAEGEDLDEEYDLDEILAELEKEDDTTSENLKEAESDEDAEEEGYEDGMEDEKEDLDDEEDEDIDLEDMSEDDLKSFIENVIEDMVTSGELEAGESFEEDDIEIEDDVEIEVEDDIEIEEAKKQGYNDKLDDAEGAKHGKKKQDMAQRRADSENMEKADGRRKFAGDSKMDEMKKDLEEAINTVSTLKLELNEINLLNAKLLYTNKVFRNKNLTENQKVKVLSAFDKAETVKEAKLVFETINSSVKSKSLTKNPVVENYRGKGSASNLSRSPKSSNKRPIVESDEMVTRFQKLAGIIKS